jgi:hypothetical protein
MRFGQPGPTNENLISGNLVKRDSLDWCITLASHAPSSGASVSFGVFHNTNGNRAPARGAGSRCSRLCGIAVGNRMPVRAELVLGGLQHECSAAVACA